MICTETYGNGAGIGTKNIQRAKKKILKGLPKAHAGLLEAVVGTAAKNTADRLLVAMPRQETTVAAKASDSLGHIFSPSFYNK